jgi:hypothetical protein
MGNELPHHNVCFAVFHEQIVKSQRSQPLEPVIGVLPNLAECGLLSALSGVQAKVLLAMLAQTPHSGSPRTTAHLVARKLHIPAPIAGAWLLAFSRMRFKGMPVVHRMRSDNGLVFYVLDNSLFEHRDRPDLRGDDSTVTTPNREAVMAHTRENFARPRPEVEQDVLLQLGHHPEEQLDTPEAMIWSEMRYLGFERDDILALIERFGVERVRRQILWLPKRRTRNRARTLVETVIRDDGPPKRLRDVLNRNAPKGGA